MGCCKHSSQIKFPFDLLDFSIPLHIKEGKSRLVISFGCTGGQHRSVTFAEHTAKHLAEKYNVKIKKFDIIYQILEDLEKTMLQLLQPEEKIVEIGQAEVRQIFTIGKTTKIAGCYVTEGKVARNKMAIVTRNGQEIFKGAIDQLKRFKDDVKEVAQGFECGISFAKFNDLEVGDIIKVTTTELVERQELV